MTISEQTLDRVQDLLERIADAAGVEAEVELHEGNDGLIAEYVGDDLSPLIGHHGQTIDAIQHLAYRIGIARGGDRVPVIVDAGGYRERRAGVLRQAADQAVAAVSRDGRPVPLEPMSALERKVIHEYLKDRREIETYSEGQEPARYLVVAPVVGL